MIIRGTPMDIEHYIKVHDEDKILKLNKKGFYPRYIDETFAYFLYDKSIINAIVDIVQQLNEGV